MVCGKAAFSALHQPDPVEPSTRFTALQVLLYTLLAETITVPLGISRRLAFGPVAGWAKAAVVKLKHAMKKTFDLIIFPPF
jgi:23S rRNA C2498 (ribose-2'-O)-methylase RlmM